MQVGLAQCVNKGMQRDYSMDKASQEFAYENRNIRITTNGDNSFLSVTNEKSTNLLNLYNLKYKIYINRSNNYFYYDIDLSLEEGVEEFYVPFDIKLYFEDSSTHIIKFEKGNYVYSTYAANSKLNKIEILTPFIFVEQNNTDSEKVEIINNTNIEGVILGSATIGDYLVLFVKNNTQDSIYKIKFNDSTGEVVTLYQNTEDINNLNFDINNPIECITSYEGDEVQKVYWVDGKNQPRYINVFPNTQYPEDTHFEFKPSISSDLNVQIDKEHNGTGKFKSGVVQYFITAYKKFGAETNLLYQSPLYYISPSDRGGNINEDQTCSFRITIGLDSEEFTNVKVYSIVRTSLNSPQGFLVGDIELQNNTGIIIDNGDNIPIDATDVLFLNDSTIIPSTIEVKDETLFLGNIKTEYSSLDSDIKDLLDPEQHNIQINFGKKILSVPKQEEDNSYYPYKPQVLSSEYSTTFKYREWYRFGIQFQSDTLEWTPSYYIGDRQNDVPITSDNYTDIFYTNFPIGEDVEEPENTIDGTMVYATLSENLVNELKNKGYKSWRLTMVPHTSGTRTIKAQGLVLPTIYNLYNKYSEIDTGSPIWSLDICHNAMHNTNVVPSITVATEPMQVDTQINLMREHTFSRIHYKDTDGKYNTLNNTEVSSTTSQSFSENYYIYSVTPKFYIYRKWKDYYYAGIIITVYDTNNNKTQSFDLGWFKEDSRLLGQRDKACKDISSWFKTVFWSAYKNKTIKIGDVTKKVSELGGYNANSKIFKSGEIPSGGKLRNKITTTGDDIIKLTPCLRNVTFDWQKDFINKYKNDYFIDAHLCNFLSPDIDNVNEDLMFRIVGSLKLNNTLSDYKITVENPVIDGTLYKQGIWNFNNNVVNGFVSGLTSFPLWHYNNKLYNIYYWHSAGPLVYTGTDNKIEYFKLTSKKIANMWYFSETTYFDKSYEFPDEDGVSKITDLEITDNIAYINNKLFKFDYENLLICNSSVTSTYALRDNNIAINETETLENINKYIDNGDFSTPHNKTTNVTIAFKSSKQAVFELPSTKYQPYVLPNYGNSIKAEQSLFEGMLSFFLTVDKFLVPKNIIASHKVLSEGGIKIKQYDGGLWKEQNNNIGIQVYDDETKETITLANFQNYSNSYIYINNDSSLSVKSISGIDSISDKSNVLIAPYKNPYNNFKYYIYCRGVSKATTGNLHNIDAVYVLESSYIFSYNNKYLYKTDNSTFNDFTQTDKYSHIAPSINSASKFLIGEFYTPYNEDSFMGGNQDSVINTQTFIPINGKYSFDINETHCAIGYGLEGDTYYQRWDHVRLYPRTENDINQNTDAFSMMVETYQNLDADYRELRGRLDTTTLTVNNTNNVLNPVYNQTNNYITSTVLDKKHEDSTHPTLYTWSLTKQAMSDIDTWTSINLSRSAKLDGDKGVLTKIKRWNNQLLAFQEKGLAVINFNQQTTISTDAGVPVEINASGLVNGHYYISSTQGCKNKWSIADSPYGIYFIDSYNKSINVYGSEGIKSLSTINLFEDWIRENEKNIIWGPNNTQGFKSFYDPIHKEVYFVNDKEALCYNELLQQFTSFYDYGNMNTLIPIDGHIYGIKNTNIYKMFEGADYCNLFEERKEYSITYKINKDPFVDKTWTNIEYRADIFSSGNIGDKNSIRNIPLETFDELEVWNEYQRGKTDLSKAKCKFRIWRSDIPRDTEAETPREKLNRIRNPWIMLKLSKSDDKRMEFHDLLIKYLQ